MGVRPEQDGRQRQRTRAHRGGSCWRIHAWRSGHGEDFHDGLVLSGGRWNATLMQLVPAKNIKLYEQYLTSSVLELGTEPKYKIPTYCNTVTALALFNLNGWLVGYGSAV